MIAVSRPEEGSTPKIEDSYIYNGDGLRSSQTISGTTSYLTWGGAGGLPLLLSDGANSYVYGPGGIPIEQITGESVIYLHHDQQGSTRMLTGETGSVEGAATYGAYGEFTASSGSASTPLGYDGQYTNADTGLIYLRARSYEPVSAQFMSVDPMVAKTRAPYSYANGNPLTFSDPSGLCGFFDLPCQLEGVANKVESGIGWVSEHPAEAAGVGLGVVSLATGVGAVAGGVAVAESTIDAAVLGAASATTGAAGAGLDTSACVEGSGSSQAVACAGAALNGAGAALGAGATLAEGSLIAVSATVKSALEYGGLGAAAAGFGVDVGGVVAGELGCG
jgi:RHS repeat-associated protein